MITTVSLGMLYTLSAFPRIRSDSPLEYTLAVSKVLMPLSYLDGGDVVHEYEGACDQTNRHRMLTQI